MTIPVARWPEAAVTLLRTYGARGATLRALHEMRRRGGAFRRAPRHRPEIAPPAFHPYRVDAARLTKVTDGALARARAERVAAGEYQAFRWLWRPLPTLPDEWLIGVGAPRGFPRDMPWWTVPHLSPDLGDIKEIWEPARFSWVYDLVRGWLVTRDPRFPDAFHRVFDTWCEASSPFAGPHWACGQETAIRAVALLYAEANLADAPASTPERMGRITTMLGASGERIEDAIGYAISQRNNHAISEATGLILLGERFAGRHPDAARWTRHGRRLLERTIREQFADDGWYIQHSFNYLRLALDQCVLAERSLRRSGATLSRRATARLRAAVELLLAVIDPATGIVPNHGHNDGSFVHPITLTAYRDYRATITAAAATFNVAVPSDVALDAEALAWLDCGAPLTGAPTADGVRVGSSGWAAVRAGGTDGAFVFLRAGRYASRPAHLDPLHLDVRLAGREVIVDPGTFSYNAPPPWRNGLATARVHNGPMLDGVEPGARGPRFLFLLWPNARVVRAGPEGDAVVIEAERPGEVSRTVVVQSHRVMVHDAALRPAAVVRSEWLLHPDADARAIDVHGGALRGADEAGCEGWFSPRYAERIPSRYVVVEHPAGKSAGVSVMVGDPSADAATHGSDPTHRTTAQHNGQ